MVTYCIIIFVISALLFICTPSVTKTPPSIPSWQPPRPSPVTDTIPEPVYREYIPPVISAQKRKMLSGPEWVVSSYGANTIPSPAEKLIMDELVKYDLLWEREVSFHGFYNEQGWLHRYDFYLPRHRLVIEYNGKDWHSLPGKIETDKIKADYLQDNNIELVVWSTSDYYHIEDRVQKLMSRLGVFMK
jgi:hypothetical protein